VEAQSGRGIHVEIDVVRLVEPPQKRNLVDEDVPDVKRVVEQGDGHQDFQPRREPQPLERSPAPSLEQDGKRVRHGLFRDLDGGGTEACHSEVAGMAPSLLLDRMPQRTTSLQPEQGTKRTPDEQSTQPARYFIRLHGDPGLLDQAPGQALIT
jgi:hypothetical protein